MKKESNISVLLGAAFLMATSAIGPGFLTQTTVFTGQLGASFGFAILVMIIIDAIAQLNVWRVIAVAKNRVRISPVWYCPDWATWFRLLWCSGAWPLTSGIWAAPYLGLNVLFGITPITGAPDQCGHCHFHLSEQRSGQPDG